jgi:hypothetical protein
VFDERKHKAKGTCPCGRSPSAPSRCFALVLGQAHGDEGWLLRKGAAREPARPRRQGSSQPFQIAPVSAILVEKETALARPAATRALTRAHFIARALLVTRLVVPGWSQDARSFGQSGARVDGDHPKVVIWYCNLQANRERMLRGKNQTTRDSNRAIVSGTRAGAW